MARKKSTAAPEKTEPPHIDSRIKGAPAPRKPRARETAARKTPGNAVAAPRATLLAISAQERYAMIAEAAYYRAEKRYDGAADPQQDWYEAEVEIAQMLEGMVSG